MSSDRTHHNDHLSTLVLDCNNESTEAHQVSKLSNGFQATLHTGSKHGDHFTTYVHGVNEIEIDTYISPDGQPALSIRVRGENRGTIVLWGPGVTVDKLVTALDAAQRITEG